MKGTNVSKVVLPIGLLLVLTSTSLAWVETFDSDEPNYPITNPVTANVTVIGGGRTGVWNSPMASATPDANGVRDLQLLLQDISVEKAGSIDSFDETAGRVVTEFDWRPGSSSTRLYLHTRGDSSTPARAGILAFLRMSSTGPFLDSNVDIDNDTGGGYCGDDDGVRYQISVHADTIDIWVPNDIYHVKWSDDAINHIWKLEINQVHGSGSGTYSATGLTDIGGVTQWAHSSRQVTLSGGLGDNYIDDFEVYQTTAPDTCAEAIADGHSPKYDLNDDCYVDLADFAIFASEWAYCMEPTNDNCSEPWNQ